MTFMKEAKNLEKRKRTKTYDGNDLEFKTYHSHVVEFLVKTLYGNLSCLLANLCASSQCGFKYKTCSRVKVLLRQTFSPLPENKSTVCTTNFTQKLESICIIPT